MKNIVTLIFLFLISLSVHAQTEADAKFINGAFSISAVGGNGTSNVGVQVAPGFGYFIQDNIAIGGSIGILSSSFGNSSSTSIRLSPFVRRYWPIVENSFYFTLNGRISFMYGPSAAVGNIDLNSSDEVFSISLDASPGFVYFPAPNWSLDIGFSGLGLVFFGIGEEGTSTGFSLGAESFSPAIGMSYYF